MRITLANGDWIDLVDRLNYAQARRINSAEDKGGTLVAAMATAWALRDTEDQPIEFPGRQNDGIPLEGLERIPFDVFTEIVVAAAALLPGNDVPKAGAGTSPGSRRANGSTSPSSWPTSSSSPITPDGATTTSSGRPLT